MAPAGDNLAEPIAVAELRAEVIDEKQASLLAEKRASISAAPPPQTDAPVPASAPDTVTPDGEFPTANELGQLRRVANTIPLKLFSIAFIELCERFSYYGCTVVCRSTYPQPILWNTPN
ncbi:hypothetical protein FDECE_7145 [Fusarium decemcellulare]|nr:hypothetical protein FDECE_7145 [Fusarium decemcellulare]